MSGPSVTGSSAGLRRSPGSVQRMRQMSASAAGSKTHTSTARAPSVAPTLAANVFNSVSWSRQARDTLANSKSAEVVSIALPGWGQVRSPIAGQVPHRLWGGNARSLANAALARQGSVIGETGQGKGSHFIAAT